MLSTAQVTTLAGGSSYGNNNGVGSNAQFRYPQAVSISPSGTFALVADSSSYQIRHIVLSTSSVSTLAGSGVAGLANGVGTNAQFGRPSGLIISADGSVALVTDSSGSQHTIRQIDISTRSVSFVAGAQFTILRLAPMLRSPLLQNYQCPLMVPSLCW
jgi:DNA-binding beta-propeller fold protein YncE